MDVHYTCVEGAVAGDAHFHSASCPSLQRTLHAFRWSIIHQTIHELGRCLLAPIDRAATWRPSLVELLVLARLTCTLGEYCRGTLLQVWILHKPKAHHSSLMHNVSDACDSIIL